MSDSRSVSLASIQYRPFRNNDPPAIVDVWRRQPSLRGRFEAVTVGVLERYVFAKPYFDPRGLIVAIEGDKVIGFAHAGFGPDESMQHITRELGVTAMLLVIPHPAEAEIRRQLLLRSEAYLRQQGAAVLYGGEMYPLNPFYLGLYGGSEVPGILESDVAAMQLYQESDYRIVGRTILLQASVHDFRPAIDRKLVLNRRRYQIQSVANPLAANWWEACSLGQSDCIELRLLPKDSDQFVARIGMWDMEPLGGQRPQRTMGIVQLEVDASVRRQGLATMLIHEAVNYARHQVCTRIEVQTMEDNRPALDLYAKLGFEQIDHGAVFRKNA